MLRSSYEPTELRSARVRVPSLVSKGAATGPQDARMAKRSYEVGHSMSMRPLWLWEALFFCRRRLARGGPFRCAHTGAGAVLPCQCTPLSLPGAEAERRRSRRSRAERRTPWKRTSPPCQDGRARCSAALKAIQDLLPEAASLAEATTC